MPLPNLKARPAWRIRLQTASYGALRSARRAFLFYSDQCSSCEDSSLSTMKIVTAGEMRAIDGATSERFGVPSLILMENAGAAVADYVLLHHAAAKRIVVFCGKGNN